MAGNSPTFRQAPSNLLHSLETRSYQAAEQPVWLNSQSISGYCSAVIPAQLMWFKWGNRDWTISTQAYNDSGDDIPRSDLRYMFDSERLIRQPVMQYVPWIISPALDPIYPVLNYACCNWTGALFGAGQSVLNLRWHLAYVKNIDAFNATIASSDNAESLATLISECQVPQPLTTYDSYVVSGGEANQDGTWNDPGDAQGWVLALMHYVIEGNAPSYDIAWHCYAAYQLHPENQSYLSSAPSTVEVPPQISMPMFNCLDRNTWIPIHNPLDFPSHLIQTRPIGP
jgi:hypothetical protein